jgi:hypothetical protein
VHTLVHSYSRAVSRADLIFTLRSISSAKAVWMAAANSSTVGAAVQALPGLAYEVTPPELGAIRGSPLAIASRGAIPKASFLNEIAFNYNGNRINIVPTALAGHLQRPRSRHDIGVAANRGWSCCSSQWVVHRTIVYHLQEDPGSVWQYPPCNMYPRPSRPRGKSAGVGRARFVCEWQKGWATSSAES